MRKQRQLGLVVEGNTTNSTILSLAALTEELGPIKSGSLRVAARLCNSVRAGYPVSQYEELAPANPIFIRVPDPELPNVVRDLCGTDLPFERMLFVLCESWLTSSSLDDLLAKGAAVTSILEMPGSRADWFLIEGRPASIRQTRRFLERFDLRTTELLPGAKQLFFAAELLSTVFPIPMLLEAQKALREAGISGHELSSVFDFMSQVLFRNALTGARKRWGGPAMACPPTTSQQHIDDLQRSHPELAALVEHYWRAANSEVARFRFQPLKRSGE